MCVYFFLNSTCEVKGLEPLISWSRIWLGWLWMYSYWKKWKVKFGWFNELIKRLNPYAWCSNMKVIINHMVLNNINGIAVDLGV